MDLPTFKINGSNINPDQTSSSISKLYLSLDRCKQIFGRRRGLTILVLI